MSFVTPPIDYSSRDYASVVTDVINSVPNYLPEWTDRSSGDFGIVLIELFAYTTDILSYYTDRIANEAFLSTAQQRSSILNIADMLDYPFSGPTAASVILTFTVPTGTASPTLFPKGTQVATPSNPPSVPVTFETDTDVVVYGSLATSPFLPNTFISTGAASQALNLNPVLNITGNPSAPFISGQTLSNLVVTVNGVTWTQVTTGVLAGAGSTATDYAVTSASTTFYDSSGNPFTGTLYTLNFGDNTHGKIPPTSNTIIATYSPYASASYSAQVSAHHGSSVTETLGTSTGAASQSFPLFRSPVVEGSIVVLVDEHTLLPGGSPVPPVAWSEIGHLVDANSTSQVFSSVLNSDGSVIIVFGDGVEGLIPVQGSTLTATYSVGGGSVGNVNVNSLTVLPLAPANLPLGTTVTNPAAALGGADAETNDHIRIHAPQSVRAANRAVTEDDYASLAQTVTTVAKAAAVAEFMTAVTLYIHPHGNFFTDSPSYASLSAAVATIGGTLTNANGTGLLDNKKMAFVSLTISPPLYNPDPAGTHSQVLRVGYVPVQISVSVQVQDQYRQSTVQSAVTSALANLLTFDVVDFGYRLPLSAVYHTLQSVPGVAWASVTGLARKDFPVSAIGDIICDVYEIPVIDPSFNSGLPLVSISGGGISF